MKKLLFLSTIIFGTSMTASASKNGLSKIKKLTENMSVEAVSNSIVECTQMWEPAFQCPSGKMTTIGRLTIVYNCNTGQVVGSTFDAKENPCASDEMEPTP